MLDAAYGSLKRASAKNRVIGGMTFSTGDISAWQWIAYMRLPNGRPPRLDLYGHNPITWRNPDLHAPQSCCGLSDYGDLLRLGRTVDRNLRRRGQPSIKFFLSEFFIPTAPDNELNVWVDPPVQADWIRAALRGVRASSRIAAFGWIHLYDDPPNPNGERVSHSGLLYADGTPQAPATPPSLRVSSRALGALDGRPSARARSSATRTEAVAQGLELGADSGARRSPPRAVAVSDEFPSSTSLRALGQREALRASRSTATSSGPAESIGLRVRRHEALQAPVADELAARDPHLDRLVVEHQLAKKSSGSPPSRWMSYSLS